MASWQAPARTKPNAQTDQARKASIPLPPHRGPFIPEENPTRKESGRKKSAPSVLLFGLLSENSRFGCARYSQAYLQRHRIALRRPMVAARTGPLCHGITQASVPAVATIDSRNRVLAFIEGSCRFRIGPSRFETLYR